MSGIQTILHPTDFSEDARYAFQTACALARENQATLIVLHVMAPSVSPLQSERLPDPSHAAELYAPAANFPWPEPSDPQIHVEHRLAEGDPAEEVLRLSADLIVMGTHGRTGLRRFLTGSVAEEVLRKSACPVLVVKSPHHPAPEVESETPANPGEVVDVRSRATTLPLGRTRTLVHTAAMEVARLTIGAGQEAPEQRCADEIVVYCVEGRVTVTTLGKTKTLDAGQLVDLPSIEPHAFRGIEPVSILLTIVNHASQDHQRR